MKNNEESSSDDAYISEESGEFEDMSISDEADEHDKSATDFSRDLSAKMTSSMRPSSAVHRIEDSQAKSSSLKKKPIEESSDRAGKTKTVSFDQNLQNREADDLDDIIKYS